MDGVFERCSKNRAILLRSKIFCFFLLIFAIFVQKIGRSSSATPFHVMEAPDEAEERSDDQQGNSQKQGSAPKQLFSTDANVKKPLFSFAADSMLQSASTPEGGGGGTEKAFGGEEDGGAEDDQQMREWKEDSRELLFSTSKAPNFPSLKKSSDDSEKMEHSPRTPVVLKLPPSRWWRGFVEKWRKTEKTPIKATFEPESSHSNENMDSDGREIFFSDSNESFPAASSSVRKSPSASVNKQSALKPSKQKNPIRPQSPKFRLNPENKQRLYAGNRSGFPPQFVGIDTLNLTKRVSKRPSDMGDPVELINNGFRAQQRPIEPIVVNRGATPQMSGEISQLTPFSRKIGNGHIGAGFPPRVTPNAVPIPPPSSSGGDGLRFAPAHLTSAAQLQALERFPPPTGVSVPQPVIRVPPGPALPPAFSSPFDQLTGPAAMNNMHNALSSLPLNQLTTTLNQLGLMPNFGGGGGGQAAAGGVAGAAHTQPINPLQLLGQSGSTLEQITNMARNIIQMGQQGGGHNGELFSALTKMVRGGAVDPSKYTSSAVSASTSVDQNNTSSAVVTDSENQQGANGSNSSSPSIQIPSVASSTLSLSNETLKALNALPPEQRNLLEAALKNGELDKNSLEEKLLNGTFNNSKSVNFTIYPSAFGAGQQNRQQQQNSTVQQQLPSLEKRLVNAETRLIEWIQQNRPRSPDIYQHQQQSPALFASTDKLPYYGRYCGSFVEQSPHQQPTPMFGQHGVSGAVWAVDDRRLLIPNFSFVPGDSPLENVTFWAGPTRIMALPGQPISEFLLLPNEGNGFYLAPEHIDVRAFLVPRAHQIEKRIAMSRTNPLTVPSSSPVSASTLFRNDPSPQTSKSAVDKIAANSSLISSEASKSESIKNSTGNGKSKELIPRVQEEEEDDRTIVFLEDDFREGNELRRRMRRQLPPQVQQQPSLYSRLFEGASAPAADGREKQGQPTTFHLATTSGPNGLRFLATPHDERTKQELPIAANESAVTAGNALHNEIAVEPEGARGTSPNSDSDDNRIVKGSLRWYAGLQPILLTMPEGRRVTSLGWLSVFDHQSKVPLATVTIPSGVAQFQVPTIVQLRPFTPNGGYQVSSGPIQVLDTKTVEIREFSLTTGGQPIWFMVGREILPNPTGQIVPTFDSESRSFDCNSLRDYRSETVILKLPPPLEWSDGSVFWFAVYSLQQQIAWAHLHIPFTDLHVPPNLSPFTAPQCIFSSSPANPLSTSSNTTANGGNTSIK